MSTNEISIRRPDDWHVHLRDGEMLQAVLPYTAQQFARAIVMPNLNPPILTANDALQYKRRICDALPGDVRFEPLMTCYLTEQTESDDLVNAFAAGIFVAAKLYPAHATTNSQFGIRDPFAIRAVLERMEKVEIPSSSMERALTRQSTSSIESGFSSNAHWCRCSPHSQGSKSFSNISRRRTP